MRWFILTLRNAGIFVLVSVGLWLIWMVVQILYTESLTSEEDIISATVASEREVQDVYQMLKDTTEMLDKAGIKYAAYSGTLLGAIRHGGLIPWDDDADLVVFEHDVAKLQSLKPHFEKLGYTLIYDGIYRVSKNGNPGSYMIKFTYPAVDISIVYHNLENNKIEYTNKFQREHFPDEWCFVDKFLPLKLYQFGPIKLYGPSDPKWYLANYYGEDFEKTIKIYPKHYNARHRTPFVLEANEALLKPALPKYELTDRVKDLDIKILE